MTLLDKILHRSKSRDSLGKHKRTASGASDKALPPSPDRSSTDRRRSSSHFADRDGVPPVPSNPLASGSPRRSVDGTGRARQAAVGGSPAQASRSSNGTAAPVGGAAAASRGFADVVVPRPDEVDSFHPPAHAAPVVPGSSSAGAPSLPEPTFDRFAVPMSAGGAAAAGDPTATSVPTTTGNGLKPSGDVHMNALTASLASARLGESGSAVRSAKPSDRAHLFASTLSDPKLNPDAPTKPTAPAPAAGGEEASHFGIHSLHPSTPQIASHEAQNAALLAKIRAEHQPAPMPFDAAAKALFATAGIKPRDPEGKGSVDWIETIEQPVLRERLHHHTRQTYQEVVVARTIHETHILPTIQPLVREPSNDPEHELHYFPVVDRPGFFYEVRGRRAAEAIVASSGGSKADRILADYWCSRKVDAERAELERLLRGGDDIACCAGGQGHEQMPLRIRRQEARSLTLEDAVDKATGRAGGASAVPDVGGVNETDPRDGAIGQAI